MGTDGARSARRIYRATLVLGGAGGALTLAIAVSALARVGIGSGAGHQMSLLGVGLETPSGSLTAVLGLALAALGIAVVVAGARAVGIALLSLRRLRRGLRIVGPLDGDPSVLVVEDLRAAAFCAGLWRPRVYVTSGAVAMLGPHELEAVIAHEETHRVRRDPLRVVSAEVLARALFFLPALPLLGARYKLLAELAADDGAVARSDRATLASAMLAFGEDTIAPERVDRLSGEQAPGWRLPAAVTGLTVAGVAALATLAIELGRHLASGTTVTVPALAGRPCVVTLAAMPVLTVALARAAMRRHEI